MTEPLAFFNGRLVAESQAAVPLGDAGFLQGTTVAEQLRTFHGQVFRLEQHLARLFRSLAIVDVDPHLTAKEMGETAAELVAYNHQLLAPGDDLGLTIFVTPGPSPTMYPGTTGGPLVCMHTRPLPFQLWARKYREGESLVTTDIEQVSPRSWPPELKCRSRMHYYLADRHAKAKEPGSRALMLDEQGFVTEATTANVVLYFKSEGLVAPPSPKVLPGISLATLVDLAEAADIRFSERDLVPDDVARADEAVLLSTSPCMLPVVRFNGRPLGSGKPGPIYGRLLADWGVLVGLNIEDQARRLAAR